EVPGDGGGDLVLGIVVDAGVGVHLLQIARRFADLLELRQFVAKRSRLFGRAGDVHDGAGVGSGESSDHEALLRAKRSASAQSLITILPPPLRARSLRTAARDPGRSPSRAESVR